MFENPLAQQIAEQAQLVGQPDPAAEAYRALALEWQNRIQRTIFAITEKVERRWRTDIERYLRHASPQMAPHGDTQFPTPLRPCATNPERYISRTCPGILHFHIGNAILAYYSLVMTGEVSPVLTTRVELIEGIAKSGLKAFIVMGNEREGFTLIRRDERPIPFLSPKQGETQPDPE